MNNNKELLQALKRDYAWQRVTVGESGAQTYCLISIHQSSLYLKIAPLSLALQLEVESQVMEWLKDKLAVPQLIAFFIEAEKEYLLMSALPGLHLAQLVAESSSKATKTAAVKLLAAGLKRMHAISVENCPFNHSLPQEMILLKERLRKKLVDESDFDESRRGKRARDLFDELVSTLPKEEELVFTHGDYCLPNIIVTAEWNISGFIDLSRAGLADRYRDLALACRSIEQNCGSRWVKLFMEQYGIKEVNTQKIQFYQLMDEFF
jgi:aminoglycoside phosphotransferase